MVCLTKYAVMAMIVYALMLVVRAMPVSGPLEESKLPEVIRESRAAHLHRRRGGYNGGCGYNCGGSGGGGSYAGSSASAGSFGSGSQSQAQSQSASFGLGPFSASFSQSQANSNSGFGGFGFF